MLEPLSLPLLYSGLFASSFIAATLIPAGSEAVLIGVLAGHPERFWPALSIATLGNSLGGMTSYALGRLIPAHRHTRPPSPRVLQSLTRFGPVLLGLSWLPVVGDGLCVAAGWLRLPPLPCFFWMSLGKCLRYAAIAYGVGAYGVEAF